MYTENQIKAAKENAALHGFKSVVSDSLAIAFLDWYFSAKTEYSSIEEACCFSLSELTTNGHDQQIAFWQDYLID